MRQNKSNKGFTLIELLIVIAIIGILAAVLIPNLLSARSRANDTVAQSCGKGLATAAEIYNIDNKGTYVGFDGAFAVGNGANSCTNTGLAVSLGTPGVNAYTFTVGHTGGTGTYEVTPSGITGPTGGAPETSSPLSGGAEEEEEG